MDRYKIFIIGGGTFSYVRGHTALAAVAFGATVEDLATAIVENTSFEGEIHTYTTRMAGDRFLAKRVYKEGKISRVVFPEWDPRAKEGYSPKLTTNEDVLRLAMEIVGIPEAKILFLPAALCDFHGTVVDDPYRVHKRTASGRDMPRLNSSKEHTVILEPASKVIRHIRKQRKDLFLVGFKETHGATEDEMFEAGLTLLKQASCNLVMVNDLKTGLNMIVTPEQARYEVTTDRARAISLLVQMAVSRSEGHFTRTNVMEGRGVFWDSSEIPQNLRTVVEHCIQKGAYRPFPNKQGKPATVGHFAVKVDDKTFITSPRGKDFNELVDPDSGVNMILCKIPPHPYTDILAYGGKPSVGGMSQRIIFKEHPGYDCIVHFHCQMRKDVPSFIEVAKQWPHECGSHECGKNTSDNLRLFNLPSGGKVKAVMLDKHGPNIVFGKDTNPQEVINFIEKHFDLSKQTSELS